MTSLRKIIINKEQMDAYSPSKDKELIRKVRSELHTVSLKKSIAKKSSTRNSKTGSLMSRNTSTIAFKIEDKKKTKVIGGHAMAVRDFSKSKKHGKYAKLNNVCKCLIHILLLRRFTYLCFIRKLSRLKSLVSKITTVKIR